MKHAILVAAILAIGLSACSKKEEAPPAAPAPAPAAAPAPAPEAASGTAAAPAPAPAEQKPEEKK
ncbi:MAG TPA: hypothetical protein VEK05_13020 [Burkholderiales bacterium]|jgi:hypothetical protein|nr:hypothetical protein [Burkholderiales bacterium]